MTAQYFLAQMANHRNALPVNDTLYLVLDELLTMVGTGVVSFGAPSGAANTCGLYQGAPLAPVLWGAHVNFKPHDSPSFVHELTHARCILCFQADMVNYAPGGVNTAANPPQYGTGNPPGAPPNTVAMLGPSMIERRQGWYRAHCKVYLDTNLQHLDAWADVTDFTMATPFMAAQKKAEIKRLTAHVANQADMDRLAQLQGELPRFGQVQKSRKFWKAKAINRQRVAGEVAHKKAYIKGRCDYGINGMGGLGDTHYEYDTVVNQMLYQMYLWGFRQTPAVVLSQLQLNQHIQNRTVPAAYLYQLIATLALDAHQRRMGNQQIANGAPAAIAAPAVVNNVGNP